MLKESTLGGFNFGRDFSKGAHPLSGQEVHGSQERMSDESSREAKAVVKSKRQPRK